MTKKELSNLTPNQRVKMTNSEAEFRVPELDHIRKLLDQFTELRKDVRSQIWYWKTQEESL